MRKIAKAVTNKVTKKTATKKAAVKVAKKDTSCATCEGRGLQDQFTLCEGCGGSGKL